MGDFDRLFRYLGEDPQLRGMQFEHVCKWFLENDPVYSHELKTVWLWRDWPGRWGGDAGIDLVAEDRNGDLWAIQAKAYDPKYRVSKKDVDKFLAESGRKVFSYRMLIATTDLIDRTGERTIQQQEKRSSFFRLNDLRAAAVDWPVSPAQLRPAKRRKPAKPRPHQAEAIRDVLKGFASSDRGQLIMACGSGKTLAGLFITEELQAQRTLVLLPSLSLLKQTLNEWRANCAVDFASLPVCSDDTVADADDGAIAHTTDLGVPVTTDPNEIAAFLRRRSGPLVVFSTYQSSPQIQLAFTLGRVPGFDLIIADEAHRAAGPVSSDFATVLDPQAIKGARRLFMTATPRYFTGRVLKAAQEADFEVASMDDETKFGPVFHRLSFGEAIERDLLTDYQVAIVGVDDATYRDWAEKGTLVTRDGNQIDSAATLAGQIGLAKAMRKYDLRRVISFHSRVKRAREFATSMPDVIDWMPAQQRPKGALWSNVATGEMPAGDRYVLLQHLARLQDGERGLLANARCLAEGVDVPTLDGVAFIDPRRSEVDIVQAVGRAIRKSDAKTVGTIVIPVFIDTDADPQAALGSSAFKPVWDVIQALRAHDAELGEELDELRRQMGGRGGKPRLPGKIRFDLPATVGRDFATAFDARLVEQTTQSWEFWYGLLQKYVAENGTARVPTEEEFEGTTLNVWARNQRSKYQRGLLTPTRVHRLESLAGWVWDLHADTWEKFYRALEHHTELTGTAEVGRGCIVDGLDVGGWANVQRTAKRGGELTDDRALRLEQLPGWIWDRNLNARRWEEGFNHLHAYVEANGDSRVPNGYRVGSYPLGAWVRKQRNHFHVGRLDVGYAQRLETLPEWTWESERDERWDSGFRNLENFVQTHGHARVPAKCVIDGFGLGTWVNSQRTRYAGRELEPLRIARLEGIPGWSWDARADVWEDGFQLLAQYAADQGHSRVPISHIVEGFRLGQWVGVQRTNRSRGTLPAARRQRLETLPGWSWNVLSDLWLEGFERLKSFVDTYGAFPTQKYEEPDGYRLGSWVSTQRNRHARGLLDGQEKQLLEELLGWTWNTRDALWESGFQRLANYMRHNPQDPIPPQTYIEPDGYKLGSWALVQRIGKSKGRLTDDRAARLEALAGWSWDPLGDAWEERYAVLLDYVASHGTSRVPQQYGSGEFRLGVWVQKQRDRHRRGTLTLEQKQRLESLPEWSWGRLNDGASMKRLTAEDRAQLRELAAAGVPITELTDRFGVGRSTAHRIANSIQ